MLTCGFWVIKWNIESMVAQKEAEEMCKQAGVTIYVPPEKWKEMMGVGRSLEKTRLSTSKSSFYFTNYTDFAKHVG